MHALLSERDKALQDLKEERDDFERNLEGLRASLREQQGQTGQSIRQYLHLNLNIILQRNRGKIIGIWSTSFKKYEKK